MRFWFWDEHYGSSALTELKILQKAKEHIHLSRSWKHLTDYPKHMGPHIAEISGLQARKSNNQQTLELGRRSSQNPSPQLGQVLWCLQISLWCWRALWAGWAGALHLQLCLLSYNFAYSVAPDSWSKVLHILVQANSPPCDSQHTNSFEWAWNTKPVNCCSDDLHQNEYVFQDGWPAGIWLPKAQTLLNNTKVSVLQ